MKEQVICCFKIRFKTKSTAKISLEMDKVNYMKKSLTLDAVLGIDLE
jgi:hypothetical protein